MSRSDLGVMLNNHHCTDFVDQLSKCKRCHTQGAAGASGVVECDSKPKSFRVPEIMEN
jgi:hypothetical protein